jgi:hypothetical protein
MGPALLPAPLSPAHRRSRRCFVPFPERASSSSRAAAVMPDRAPCVRSAPGVLLHRDARRIEPDRRGGESVPIVTPRRPGRPSAPFGVSNRQAATGHEAGDGPRQTVGPAREEPFRPPGGSKPNCCVPAVRPSLRKALCSVFRSLARPAEAGCSSLHPNRGNSANGCVPLAASAVRQAGSRRNPRDVFSDAAAGNAAASPGLNFLFSHRGLLLRAQGIFRPFR